MTVPSDLSCKVVWVVHINEKVFYYHLIQHMHLYTWGIRNKLKIWMQWFTHSEWETSAYWLAEIPDQSALHWKFADRCILQSLFPMPVGDRKSHQQNLFCCMQFSRKSNQLINWQTIFVLTMCSVYSNYLSYYKFKMFMQ